MEVKNFFNALFFKVILRRKAYDAIKGRESGHETDRGEVVRISKDGDTLELSKTKIPDAQLKSCSEARLKQLFKNGEISRQQYDKAMKDRVKDGMTLRTEETARNN